MRLRKKFANTAALFAAVLCVWGVGGMLYGQDLSDDTVQLPAVELSGDKETTEFITREQMDRRGDSDLIDAIRWVPGLVPLDAGGARNESGFTMRGLGQATVPVYLDGVPWGDPYGAQIDYSRFLTTDIESISINKGYSSMMLGSNNMGGVIVMRAAKPKKPFEASLKSSWDLDDAFSYGGNLQTFSAGTKLDLFYAKASFTWRDVDHWRLPKSFEPWRDAEGNEPDPGNGGNPQKTGERRWSKSNDMKVSALFGFTPGENIDVWASYSYSDSDKGVSPPSVDGTNYSVWEWPYVRRHTVSLNGDWNTDNFSVHAAGFFDKYNNRLYTYPYFGGRARGDLAYNSWLDDDYSTSDYDDYTFGVTLQGAYNINSSSKIAGNFDFKQFSHKSFDKGDGIGDEFKQTADVSEDLIFAGAEYTVKLSRPLTLAAGLGVNIYVPGNMDNYNSTSGDKVTTINSPETQAAPTAQLGAFYDIGTNHEFHLTWALKNRYPTMKEKFSSLGTGTNKANPDLTAEYANHFEFGYKGYFIERINITSAIFYTRAFDRITNVALTGDPDGYTSQYQNIDETAFYGFEFGTEMYISRFLSLGGALGYTKSEIISSKAGYTRISGIPEFTANGYAVIKPFETVLTGGGIHNVLIIPGFEFFGSRAPGNKIAAGDTALPDYTLASIKVSADFGNYVSASLSVHNLFDELYESSQYFPQAGRSYNFTLSGKY
ncbi:MAG: TonB-dependent receptor [Spirochaetaceae bacterium]|jgi:iron complex outermembrane receptor protein|nr:TonB-dependent receptor [Spirochaetaceae bacterium]